MLKKKRNMYLFYFIFFHCVYYRNCNKLHLSTDMIIFIHWRDEFYALQSANIQSNYSCSIRHIVYRLVKYQDTCVMLSIQGLVGIFAWIALLLEFLVSRLLVYWATGEAVACTPQPCVALLPWHMEFVGHCGFNSWSCTKKPRWLHVESCSALFKLSVSLYPRYKPKTELHMPRPVVGLLYVEVTCYLATFCFWVVSSNT